MCFVLEREREVMRSLPSDGHASARCAVQRQLIIQRRSDAVAVG